MAQQDKPRNRSTIGFSYKQSPLYRNVSARGAYGGLTVMGDIFMGIYSERTKFPESSTITVDSDGTVVTPEVFVGHKGIVRELEIGVFMTLETAKAYRIWLDDKISALEKVQASGQKVRVEETKT